MSQKVGFAEFVEMLRGAAAEIRKNHEALSRLDSFGGDGDHGTTMVRAMDCLEKAIEESTGPGLSDLLYNVGWAVMGVDGGATGPLFGAFFMGMAEPITGRDTLDVAALAGAFEGGLAGVRQNTRAQVGDKTVIDALVPAVEALHSAIDSGASVLDALEQAAQAAERGAASTKELQARFGRAKNVGEGSVGEQDPGATSVSLLFKGFFEGLQSFQGQCQEGDPS